MRLIASLFMSIAITASLVAAPKSYRLSATSLKSPIIWGATCDGPAGSGLAFGGQDQKSEDGRGHTAIKTKDGWKSIYPDLEKRNPLKAIHDSAGTWATTLRKRAAEARSVYLAGGDRMKPGKELEG